LIVPLLYPTSPPSQSEPAPPLTDPPAELALMMPPVSL
jgi:hypothetical protein